MSRALPAKSPLPAAGKNWNWLARYFDVGDSIEWISRFEGEAHSGRVAKVTKNLYGRISYQTETGEQLLTEDVARAHGAGAMRGTGK